MFTSHHPPPTLTYHTINTTHHPAPAQVHLHSKVGAVRIASAGGKVRVAVSPEAKVEVAIRAAGRVACPPGGALVPAAA